MQAPVSHPWGREQATGDVELVSSWGWKDGKVKRCCDVIASFPSCLAMHRFSSWVQLWRRYLRCKASCDLLSLFLGEQLVTPPAPGQFSGLAHRVNTNTSFSGKNQLALKMFKQMKSYWRACFCVNIRGFLKVTNRSPHPPIDIGLIYVYMSRI